MTTSIAEENGLAQATADGPTQKRSKKARVAARRASVGSSKAKASKKATPGKKAAKSPKPATSRKATREGTKTETILALMQQPGGATLNALMEASGWQAHSVRGFTSAVVTKKMGLTVESTKPEGGERTYSIA